jgi:hypothetical protein
MVGADQTGAESLLAKVRASLFEALAPEESAVTCSIGCVAFRPHPLLATLRCGPLTP